LVERGDKSITVDTLYRASVALKVPLRQLTDVPPERHVVPSGEAEKIFALVSARQSRADARRVYDVLQKLLGPVDAHRRGSTRRRRQGKLAAESRRE
jgi:hypothetical protein